MRFKERLDRRCAPNCLDRVGRFPETGHVGDEIPVLGEHRLYKHRGHATVTGAIDRPLLGRCVRQQLRVEESGHRTLGRSKDMPCLDDVPEQDDAVTERSLEFRVMCSDGIGGLVVGEGWHLGLLWSSVVVAIIYTDYRVKCNP